ncbi:hypothetical protein RRG08_025972 [Elysia crispata]|uniref:Uncharacterized protein n=1 Tax=Elysia crispata TaxID=231223 RepID=A0AAE0ZFZ5_9GAST|nr:hypothetical protein RRG08_025972 [Elysia crispata]
MSGTVSLNTASRMRAENLHKQKDLEWNQCQYGELESVSIRYTSRALGKVDLSLFTALEVFERPLRTILYNGLHWFIENSEINSHDGNGLWFKYLSFGGWLY